MKESPPNAIQSFEHVGESGASRQYKLLSNTQWNMPERALDVESSCIDTRDDHESLQSSPIKEIKSYTSHLKGREKLKIESNISERNLSSIQLNNTTPEPFRIISHHESICTENSSRLYSNEKETQEDRIQRELEESEALARQLMAEEAVASYNMATEFIIENTDHYSNEDLTALRAAMADESQEEDGELNDMISRDLSYDTMLRISERIGNVKEERWSMVASQEIRNIPIFLFETSIKEGKDQNHTEIKCLICQYPYEKGEELRRLPCHHCFHRDCIDVWLQTKDTCAFCRKSIVQKD